ncbi:MAG: glycoside hydrolase family 28 protein [Ferruginibacter sp.]
MKQGALLTALLIICFALSSQAQDHTWTKDVGAKSFPSGSRIFVANKYGAKSDTTKNSTKAIQKAIDDCAAKGGGIVTLNPGTYVTGALFIKSNVQLRIDEGVLILGSTSFDDYPEIDTRVAGLEMKWPAALFNIIDQKNAALTGKGVVNARGKFCWDKYWAMRKDYDKKGLRWIVDYDAKRIRTVLVQNSTNITVKDLTFKNAGFWTIQLLYSQYLTVDGVTIKNNEDGHGPSTDGVDIDSSSWVLVQNSDIDCNDDNFCLKAGRDWDGLRVNRPTEYVVIRDCIARRGDGLVTLGSETSGGIRHVLATNLKATNTGNGLRIKSATTRGGTVEDVYFENSQMDSVKYAFSFNLNWYPAYSYSTLPAGYVYDSIPAHWKAMLQKVTPAERGTPHAKDIYVKNIKITNAGTAFNTIGLEQSAVSGFHFTDCSITAGNVGILEYTRGWKFNNVEMDIDKKYLPAPEKPAARTADERIKN